MKRFAPLALAIGSTVANPIRRLIVEGERLEDWEYPFIVKLTSYGRSFCTGSLIAPDVVITAAHCVFSSVGENLLPDADITLLHIGGGSQLRMVSSARNRDYLTAREDLALIFLDSPVRIIPGVVETVKIESGSTAEPRPCDRVTTAGFGVSSVGPSMFTISDGQLRDIKDFNVHPSAICGKGTTLYKNGAHFCFGKDDVRQTCRGDSGGPVIMKDDSGQWKLVGINIYGADSSCVSGPSYALRVAPFALWIEETIAKYSVTLTSFDHTSIFTQYPIGDVSLTLDPIQPKRRGTWRDPPLPNLSCTRFAPIVDKVFDNHCRAQQLEFHGMLKSIEIEGFQWDLHAQAFRDACKPVVECATAHSETLKRWNETRQRPCWGPIDASFILGSILNPCIEDIPHVADSISRRPTVKEDFARELAEMGLEPCPAVPTETNMGNHNYSI